MFFHPLHSLLYSPSLRVSLPPCFTRFLFLSLLRVSYLIFDPLDSPLARFLFEISRILINIIFIVLFTWNIRINPYSITFCFLIACLSMSSSNYFKTYLNLPNLIMIITLQTIATKSLAINKLDILYGWTLHQEPLLSLSFVLYVPFFLLLLLFLFYLLSHVVPLFSVLHILIGCLCASI